MMQIQWQDGVRVHVGCGGEPVIVPGEGYICTTCGEQSFSDTLSDEEQERQEQERQEQERQEQERQEQERQEQEDKEAQERERDEYERREREQGYK